MDIKEKIRLYFTKENLKAELRELVETIFFVIIALIVIRFFIFEPRIIPSASMHPTLIEKDRLIIERVSRFFTTPQRGDIIVFYPPHEELKGGVLNIFKRLTGLFCKDIAYIKRVIGLPNEKVEIKKEFNSTYSVYINGEKIEEPYIKSSFDYPSCREGMFCKIELKDNEYFVLGDNRGNSLDSRFWGPVKKDRIIGVNKIRFWPLNRLHYFKQIKY